MEKILSELDKEGLIHLSVSVVKKSVVCWLMVSDHDEKGLKSEIFFYVQSYEVLLLLQEKFKEAGQELKVIPTGQISIITSGKTSDNSTTNEHASQA